VGALADDFRCCSGLGGGKLAFVDERELDGEVDAVEQAAADPLAPVSDLAVRAAAPASRVGVATAGAGAAGISCMARQRNGLASRGGWGLPAKHDDAPQLPPISDIEFEFDPPDAVAFFRLETE
jgi:hypothetical protein